MQTKTNPNVITLKFPDLYILWSFAQTIDSKSIEINASYKSLTCACSESDVVRAIFHYQAKILEGNNGYTAQYMART